MPASGRRLSNRNPLHRPVEGVLALCGGERVGGWIVNEQDEGLGMAFGGPDVERIQAHRDCCLREPVRLWIGDSQDEANRPVPMRLVHVTAVDAGKCLTGLTFDVARMKSADIVHLLGVWRNFVVEQRVRRRAQAQ